jgi:ubiquitin-conjugating enzyme E2 Q
MEKDLAKAFANGGSAAATKVITKEYMRLMKLQTRGQNEGIVVSMPDEANGYRWAVAVTPPDDTALFNELQAFAYKHSVPAHIEMEMLFSQDFPMNPPFVRVLRPRFAFHTGHVTLGGSICIELLTSSGWSPAYSIESLLIQLRSLFIVGEARLDPLRPNVAYGEQEAREAFHRVAAQHGWRV